MNPTPFKKTKLILLMALAGLLFQPCFTNASEWINPKDYFQDPNTVRLQRGQQELTELEKKEVKTYGFTGLEFMTYLYYNQEPGLSDKDCLTRLYNITPNGNIFRTEYLDRMKYYYRDKLALIKLDGIKVKDTYRK